uniref:Septin-type G domain-containing protein n=2 Tax=Tetradesmus obliquus TaxID=3088 RepID=A0A383VIX7_TETOB|eukprot:jgi/Sobl393_1/17232/SZX65161.1
MAPATKGLSLFNLSLKKDKASKSKKTEVEGGMVLKQDVSKPAAPAVDPKKALLLSDPKKQQQPAAKPAAEPAKDVKKIDEPLKKAPEPAKPAAAAPVSAKPAASAASKAPEAVAAPTSAKPAAEQQKQQPEAPKKEEAKKTEEKPATPKPAASSSSSSSPAPAAPVAATPVMALPAPVAAPVATLAPAAPTAPAAAAAAAAKEVSFQAPASSSSSSSSSSVPQEAPAAPKPVETTTPAAAAAPAAASPKADATAAPVPLPLAAEAAAKAAEKSAVAKAAAQEAAQREAAAAAAAAFEAASKEAAAAAAAATAAAPAPTASPKKTSGKAAPQPVPEPTNMSRMRAEDARAAWQTRPRVPVRLLDSYVNFMVVGESGLGKTTFINNLVSSYTTTGKTHDGSSTSLADFQSDPDRLKTVLEPMEVREAGRRLHVTVQDMPGWADDINLVRFLRIMVTFILAQRAKDYELLAGGRALTESAMCGQLQNSITACVYFLTPHRVKKVDLIMMSALSQLVTVIPVVAKADTMTDEELATFRQEIRTRLAAPFKYVHSKTLAPLEFNKFAFDECVMSALGLKDDMMPLAIITSNKHEPVEDASLLSQLGLHANSEKVEQPVRQYKWGQAYALNREHSDLIVLKRLLLGDRVDSLYAMLDQSYKRYVEFCEQYEEAGNQLPLIVQDELACSAYLEYDDYSNAKSALDAAQQAMSTLMAENKVLVERLNSLEREKGLRYKATTSTN